MKTLRQAATSKQGTLGFRVSKYMELHRTAKCGEDRCRLVVSTELSLGLPEDPYERSAWYEAQRKKFKAWDSARIDHQWSWAKGKCHECGVTEAIVIRAGKQNICAQWCLNTILPEYPAGMPTAYLADLVTHSESCTSHSWSQICESTENLSEMLSQWQATMLKARSSYTSSSSAKTKKSPKSSKGGHSQNSASPSQKLPGFNIPKKSS